MSKPRRGTAEVFYDTFADWDVADQAQSLKVLEGIHRQANRNAMKALKPKENKPDEPGTDTSPKA